MFGAVSVAGVTVVAEVMKESLFKVVLIGDGKVGKTSFVGRYVKNLFRTNYKATMGVDFTLKVIQWSEDRVVKLQFWDIAGQESFTSQTHIYYRNASAALAMFDVTCRVSFESAIKWKADLDRKVTLVDGSPVPCLLLANKCDEVDDRVVSQEEIEELCRDHDFAGWSEISVKDGIMVKECMGFLIEEMMAKKHELEGSTESYRPHSPGSGDTIKLKAQTVEETASSGKWACRC